MANLKIGAPNHLSVRPLIHGLVTSPRPNVVFRHGEPGELADALEQGRLDAALVPSIEFLRGVGSGLVPGPALVVKGRTGAIILVTDRPIHDVRRIAVAANCRTPVAVLRVVLDKLHHVMPDFCVSRVDAETWRGEYDAILLDGDHGLRYSLNGHPANDICYDLGAMWCSLHQAPLVVAVWAYNDAALSDELRDLLVESRDCGVRDLTLLAESMARTTSYGSEFLYRFLSAGLGYDLGPDEEAGLKRLESYGVEYRLIRRPRVEPRPVAVPVPVPIPNSLSSTIG